MATKKTTAKKKTTPTPEETTAKKSTTKTDPSRAATYRSGDITRLSMIALMLGIVFVVGLLLGLSMGSKNARKNVFRQLQGGDVILKEDNTSEDPAEVEEAQPNVPTPQQETPVLNTLEDEEEPVESNSVDSDMLEEAFDTTVPSN